MLPCVVICIMIPCRLVHSGRQMTALSGNEVLTFGLRSGTRQGVEAHTFRVETQRDLSTWTRAAVQAAHNAAVLIKEVSCSKYPFYEFIVELIVQFCKCRVF